MYSKLTHLPVCPQRFTVTSCNQRYKELTAADRNVQSVLPICTKLYLVNVLLSNITNKKHYERRIKIG
jgi:hypothetical protein